MKFDREDKYDGFIINQEVIKTRESIRSLQIRIDADRNRIQEIQDSCDHSYKFYCRGMYKDFYICIKCGDETEH